MCFGVLESRQGEGTFDEVSFKKKVSAKEHQHFFFFLSPRWLQEAAVGLIFIKRGLGESRGETL